MVETLVVVISLMQENAIATAQTGICYGSTGRNEGELLTIDTTTGVATFLKLGHNSSTFVSLHSLEDDVTVQNSDIFTIL